MFEEKSYELMKKMRAEHVHRLNVQTKNVKLLQQCLAEVKIKKSGIKISHFNS